MSKQFCCFRNLCESNAWTLVHQFKKFHCIRATFAKFLFTSNVFHFLSPVFWRVYRLYLRIFHASNVSIRICNAYLENEATVQIHREFWTSHWVKWVELRLAQLLLFCSFLKEKIEKNFSVFEGLKNPISNRIYMRSNEQVEKLSQTLTFALRDLTMPLMLGPVFFISFAKYFLNGLDNDAFQMPFAAW